MAHQKGVRAEKGAAMTAVYRLYDSALRLLYVGASNNPTLRLSQHKSYRKWGREIHSQTCVWFRSLDAALDEETRAIRLERPKHNRNKVVAWTRPIPIRLSRPQLRDIKKLKVKHGIDRSTVLRAALAYYVPRLLNGEINLSQCCGARTY